MFWLTFLHQIFSWLCFCWQNMIKIVRLLLAAASIKGLIATLIYLMMYPNIIRSFSMWFVLVFFCSVHSPGIVFPSTWRLGWVRCLDLLTNGLAELSLMVNHNDEFCDYNIITKSFLIRIMMRMMMMIIMIMMMAVMVMMMMMMIVKTR